MHEKYVKNYVLCKVSYSLLQRNALQHKKNLTKLMEREKKVGTVSWCMLEEYVKDNYYARFHTAITSAVKCTFVLDLVSGHEM